MLSWMPTEKNKAAVELGRLGGKKRGVKKGFAADPERARKAGAKSGKVRRKAAAKKAAEAKKNNAS